jgi:CRP-like cAMP-binding protein
MSPASPSSESILRRCRLLGRLSPESVALLAEVTSVRTFEKGTRIFEQGDPCPGLYCVATGLVRVYRLAPSGKEHVLHVADPGTTFGEVAAIVGMPAPACAEAVKQTLCAVIPSEQLQRALESSHPLCLQLLGGMAGWVKQLVGLLEDVVLRDASGRVARHLLEAGASAGDGYFQLRLLKRDLASHLNLTSETLSRTLRRLGDSGLIETGEGQRLRIVDREALDQVARGLLPAEFE